MSFVKTITILFMISRLSKSIVMWRQSWSSHFLYFSKTTKICRHVETIIVIHFSLLSQDYQSLLFCGDNHRHLLFFTFPRLSKSIALRRLSMSSAFYLFKDHQSLLFQSLSESFVSKTIRVFRRDFNVSFTLQGFKVFLWIYPMPLILSLLTGFTAWASISVQSDGKIA